MALAVRSAARLKPEIRLAQAISEYEAILLDVDKAEFRALRSGPPPGVSQVMEITAAIDRSNGYRKSRRCFGPRLTNVLESVQQFSTIVDIIIGGSQSLIASAIWGTLKMTLQITSAFASYFDNLSALFMSIGRSCPRHQDYSLLYTNSSRLQGGLCDYFSTIVKVCMKAVLFIRKPLIAQLSSALRNPFRSEFGPLENELSMLSDLIRDEALLAMNQQTGSETREASAFRALVSTRASRETQEAKRLNSQKLKMQFLDACSTFNHQTAWKRVKKAGTSSRMYQEPLYTQWVEEASSAVLWYTGKLGSGKTVSTASLVQETIIRNPSASVAYFFCSHDHKASLQASSILGSIARQILTGLGPEHFDTTRISNAATLDEEEMVASLLQLLYADERQYFVIIDGLDECNEAELIKLLQSLQRLLKSEKCFHIFCSSRPDMGIRYRAFLEPRYEVSLSDENPEIAQYIDLSLECLLETGSLIVRDPSIVLAIRDALLNGSQGMFLWVVFQLESICAELTDGAILDALLALPRDLPETFDRILYKLRSEKKTEPELCRKIFTLIAAAQRPLTMEELREATSVISGQTIWDPKKLLNDMQKALAGCGSLLSVEEEDLTVHFAHHSVRQYVLSSPQDLAMREYHVKQSDAELTMGSICVTYLNLDIWIRDVSKHGSDKHLTPGAIASSVLENTIPYATVSRMALKILRNRTVPDFDLSARLMEAAMPRQHGLQTNHFLAYAIDFWLVHTKKFTRGSQVPYESWRRLIDGHVAIITLPWAPMHWSRIPQDFLRYVVDNEHGALLYETVQKLWNMRPADADSPCFKLTMMLLEKGPDYSVEGRFYGPILAMVCSLANPRHLSYQGVDVAALRGIVRESSSVPIRARRDLHRVAIQLLLRRNILVDGILEDAEYCLIAGILDEWQDFVALLVKVVKIDINAKSDMLGRGLSAGWTPLSAAVETGQIDIVNLLLKEDGIDINVRNCFGDTALGRAIQQSEITIAGLLLKQKDLDVNTLATKTLSPLVLSVSVGSVKMVEMLLEREDVDVNARDIDGDVALMVAAAGGRTKIVELLLGRKEIDVNLRDSQGRPVLFLAVNACYKSSRVSRQNPEDDPSTSHSEVLGLLLARTDVDINAKVTDYGGPTVLHIAVTMGDSDFVKVLLERSDIDTEILNAAGQTPLGFALSQGSELTPQVWEIVRVLREHQAHRRPLPSPTVKQATTMTEK